MELINLWLCGRLIDQLSSQIDGQMRYNLYNQLSSKIWRQLDIGCLSTLKEQLEDTPEIYTGDQS